MSDAGAEPRIALRDDDKGELDDIVVRNVEMFRAERMSSTELWMCCYFPNTDERITFSVRARRGRLDFTTVEQPHGDEFTYEPQPTRPTDGRA